VTHSGNRHGRFASRAPVPSDRYRESKTRRVAPGGGLAIEPRETDVAELVFGHRFPAREDGRNDVPPSSAHGRAFKERISGCRSRRHADDPPAHKASAATASID
jgi:hypothetical protein